MSYATSSSSNQFSIIWPPNNIINLKWIQDLTYAFDWSSMNLHPFQFPSILPVEVVVKLILTACGILGEERNYVEIEDLDSNSTVVVVGDVHGQLHDLIFLLDDAGFPDENRFFVFNGDYVDRGAWGLETFLVLLAWKVFMPHRVYLLRGNHESKYCTRVYGFQKEVLAKYGENGSCVYEKCLECFAKLPLASTIAGHVFTAHGGLFRSMQSKRRLFLGSLEDLAKIDRSILDPSSEDSNLIPGDILWSDPSMELGLSQNTERGLGLLWGPDCTEKFLKKGHFKLIIRSHEGPDAREKRPGLCSMNDGYTIDHVVDSGKLITVFSAPDYPQFQATEDRYKNKGAYIVLKSPNFDQPEFHSFEAITPRPHVEPYYDVLNVIDSDEELELTAMAREKDGSSRLNKVAKLEQTIKEKDIILKHQEAIITNLREDIEGKDSLIKDLKKIIIEKDEKIAFMEAHSNIVAEQEAPIKGKGKGTVQSGEAMAKNKAPKKSESSKAAGSTTVMHDPEFWTVHRMRRLIECVIKVCPNYKGQNISWKKVLEEGGDVFEGKTTRQLLDKWTYIYDRRNWKCYEDIFNSI